jgi:tyrosyl-tRNA synthetase
MGTMDTQPRNAYDVLAERGFVYHVTDERGLRAALSQRATIYCGFDPTAGSLTIGHLLQIMALRHLQQHGHRTIAVVGGGTGLVGDPSGKSEARPLLSQADIAANVAVVRQQLADYVGAGQGEFVIVDNATWLHELNHISFLRDVGRHFNINEMLASETYRTRLDTTGLSYLELSYRPLQGYDFLHLHRTYNCICQIGGSDQWSNILAGVDLIRRAERQRVFGMVTPLITTASGAKMGKTESGAIWLDPELTSPYEFYQFWMNVDDADVEGLLALYTFLPLDRVRELGRFEGSDIRQAKEVLAYEATQTVHGPAAAMEARAAYRSPIFWPPPDLPPRAPKPGA